MATLIVTNPPQSSGLSGFATGNSSQVTIIAGAVTQHYYGFGFTFFNGAVTGGTVTGTDLYDTGNGGLQYTINGLSHSAVTTYNLVQANNAEGLRAFFLNGGDLIIGSEQADSLRGYTGNDSMAGGNGNDTLTGDDGDDVLDGGAGNDSLVGGAGDDTYLVDSAADTIVETAASGYDTVESQVSFTLAAELEKLLLTGSTANGTGNAQANLIVGNGADNILDGGAGADTLDGGAGDDLYLVDHLQDVTTDSSGNDTVRASIGGYTLGAGIENLELTGVAASGSGNAGDNLITGNALDNTLTGNGGNDTLDGGAGADTLDGGAGDDTYVVEGNADTVVESAGGGIDTAQSVLSATLAAEVERLELTGGDAINGTGNALANFISGNAANNLLDGGSGIDTLQGGAGDDTYVVDNEQDSVRENPAAGDDAVQASVTYGLQANLERLTLSGSANIDASGNDLANLITGNSGGNALEGGDGNDTLDGGEGNDNLGGGTGFDSLIGGNGDDTLRGGEQADTLAGGEGNDLITGGKGFDFLYGGNGNDTLAGMVGNDVIDGGAGFDLADYSTSVDGVSVSLLLTGAAQTASTGSGTDLLTGIEGLIGSMFNDLLTGDLNANRLAGGAGADILNGDYGNDTIDGGDGDDYLLGGFNADVITGGNGNDTLGGGNGFDNLDGGDGNDSITGGLGADTVTGGLGADRFVFRTALNVALNIDLVSDFVSGTDLIELSATIFTAFAGQEGQTIGLNANLTYDNSNGALAYDADGAGPGAGVVFAILGSAVHPASPAADFAIAP